MNSELQFALHFCSILHPGREVCTAVVLFSGSDSRQFTVRVVVVVVVIVGCEATGRRFSRSWQKKRGSMNNRSSSGNKG